MGERGWPKKELEESESEVIELWSAAMAAIDAVTSPFCFW